MIELLANLRALQAIRTQQEQLAVRKRDLEKEARQSSAQTRSRACRLVTDATLALLSRGASVNPASLTQEIEARAYDRDRFVVALARDWLDEAARASGAPMRLLDPKMDSGSGLGRYRGSCLRGDGTLAAGDGGTSGG